MLFAVNRNLSEAMELELRLEDFDPVSVLEHESISHPDLKAVNSAAEEKVRPVKLAGATLEKNTLKTVLPAASWNMIRISIEK